MSENACREERWKVVVEKNDGRNSAVRELRRSTNSNEVNIEAYYTGREARKEVVQAKICRRKDEGGETLKILNVRRCTTMLKVLIGSP